MFGIRFVALAALLLASTAQAEDIDWWKVQRDLDRKLLAGEADLWRMAARVEKAPPTTAEGAWLRLIACVRTGQPALAATALDHLRKIEPPRGGFPVSTLYYHLCDRYECWVTARLLLEAFEETVNDVSLGNRLIKRWQETGWTDERIDAWLAARGDGRQSFWFRQRVYFRGRCGTAGPLLDQVAAAVRADPADFELVRLLLDAARMARVGSHQTYDFGWMATTLSDVAPLEAWEIGRRLANLGAHEEAIVFIDRALVRPLTDDEVRRYSAGFQAVLPVSDFRHGFTAQVHDKFARSLLALNRAADAQAHVELAASIREEHGLPQSFQLAGQIQAASGARTIEGRIQAREKLSEDDPRYWLDRADYYRGRNEPEKEESALERALALCDHEAPAQGKSPWPMRSRVVFRFDRFLERQGREAEAVALLREQLRNAPPDSHAATHSARRLAYQYNRHLVADDSICWGWLGKRLEWVHGEDRLLLELLERARGAKREALLTKAERLADGTHPSRAYAVGCALRIAGAPRRSIVLLKDAHARSTDYRLKRYCLDRLFDSYIVAKLWREAEGLLPSVTEDAGTGEILGRYARLAACAARAGDTENAIRLWRKRVSIDPMDVAGIDRAVNAGLAIPLSSLYAQWVGHPDSIVAARAARAIEAAQYGTG